jgi:ubiquinol-cytochrome c reductase cytochrome c1 subunit
MVRGFKFLLVLGAVACALPMSSVMAAGGGAVEEGAVSTNPEPLPEHDWSFQGPVGTYDRAALQRGFQVYRQVCSSCHGLKRVAFRNLADLGYSPEEIKAIAAEYQVTDGPNDEGEMFQRKATPADHLVGPYANEKAARAANNGAYPPDQSLIIKARHDGANYVRALLLGYESAPEGMKMQDGMHYNKYFPGRQIAMANPLSEGVVTYQDGTAATPEQMANDVVTFLSWAAEPEAEARKRMGAKVLIFLIPMTILLYLLKRKIWADVKKKKKAA